MYDGQVTTMKSYEFQLLVFFVFFFILLFFCVNRFVLEIVLSFIHSLIHLVAIGYFCTLQKHSISFNNKKSIRSNPFLEILQPTRLHLLGCFFFLFSSSCNPFNIMVVFIWNEYSGHLQPLHCRYMLLLERGEILKIMCYWIITHKELLCGKLWFKKYSSHYLFHIYHI